MKESSTAKIIISFFLTGIICLYCGCSLISPRLSLPSYTLLKEYRKDCFPNNIPNGSMGQYIVLNNNLQTYIAHAALQEEIGIWRMRGDTLFLEPQLFTSLWQKDPGMFHHIENLMPRQFLLTKNTHLMLQTIGNNRMMQRCSLPIQHLKSIICNSIPRQSKKKKSGSKVREKFI